MRTRTPIPTSESASRLLSGGPEHPVGEALDREGLYLCSYSYHGQAGVARVRYELDPDGHPEIPYHRHPPGEPDHVRRPAGPTSPETALDELDVLGAAERAAGRL